MAKPVQQWLARVFGLEGRSQQDDGYASFERVDGSRLAVNEFHQSDSMRLDELHLPDFAETLPAYSHHAVSPTLRAPRLAATLYRVSVASQRAH